MKIKIRIVMRKLHKWGSVIIALPLLIVIISGILLQIRKEVPWVQPRTLKGSQEIPTVTFHNILEAVKTNPDAQVKGWRDIERLDVRPDMGIIKVRCKNNTEIQLDAATGQVLQQAFRRSEIIKSIHEGSWFYSHARLWIFLPSAFILLILWMTGIILLFPIRKHK